MNFLQKKLWIAWSKFRFLRLPVERRVRLEVTTDGRHITFLLVSLYEAGYGVQVVGSPAVFRELICLRKSAPIPFVVGGKEYEVGISITDQPSTLDDGRSSLFVLDYDYFFGLTTPRRQGSRSGDCRRQPERARREGSSESTCPKKHETGKIIEPRMTRIYTDGQQGDAQGTCAGDAFSNPSTSELAQDSENTSPTRSASVPAGSHIAPEDRISQIGARVTGSDGGNQPADSAGFLEGQLQAGLQMDNQKGPTIRTANDPTAPGEYSSSVKFDSLDPSRLALRADLRSLHLTPAPALDCSQNASSPATSNSPLVTAPEAHALDARPSTLDSSVPVTSHSPLATALRAPYFMHPSVYHRGLHKRRAPSTALDSRLSTLDSSAKQRRRFRIGFFGTHDREFYTKHYHFPGMNRFEILEVFLQKFGNRMKRLRGFPRDWDPCEIAVSIDGRGGDRQGKSFLPQEQYFAALRECDFVLSPPGWCMPVSHNLIEAMFCGAIPITNAGSFMAEPLTDGLNCLELDDAVGLVSVIERALAMGVGEVSRMQQAVRDYYERFLEPEAWFPALIGLEVDRFLVNAEEKSVPFVFPGKL